MKEICWQLKTLLLPAINHEYVNKHDFFFSPCSCDFKPNEYLSSQYKKYSIILCYCGLAGGDVDWETLDIEIICGYFAPQSGSPHQTLSTAVFCQ